MRKYVLTDEKIYLPDGSTIYRIKALKDFGDVKAGDLGGFIEKESNLSHEGICWVFDEARVYGESMVLGDAQISREAMVFGKIQGSERAQIAEKAWVYGNARISGKAMIYGNARVYGNAQVFGEAQVSEKAKVYGDAMVCGKALIHGDAQVCEEAKISGEAKVSETAIVRGDVRIDNKTILRGVDEIFKDGDFINIYGFIYDITTTITSIHVGCRDFTLDDLDKGCGDVDSEEQVVIKNIITQWLEYKFYREMGK